MSVAFTRGEDVEAAAAVVRDRPFSPHGRVVAGICSHAGRRRHPPRDVPLIPMVVTFGETEADARRHAVDAIETALASMIDNGEDIPRAW